MKETGLPLIAPMVLATLADQKTNTRRVMLPQPEYLQPDGTIKPLADVSGANRPIAIERLLTRCPYGGVGDRLWVREACAIGWHDGGPLAVDYHADGTRRYFEPDTDQKAQAAAAYIGDSRRPPFLMPKWACRIWLEITSVRVERVRDISEEDCQAEGVQPDGRAGVDPHKYAFKRLWDELNKSRGYGWSADPWVWAITFRRLRESEE